MNQHEQIDWLGTPTKECIIDMVEGNPGAMTVIMQLLHDTPAGIIAIMKLDEHNIRGSDIWVGYTRLCNSDLGEFYNRALRDTRALAAEIKEHRTP